MDAREKEAYAIVMALRKWAGYIALHPVTVCTEPSESAVVAQGARGHPLRSRLPTGKMARDLGQVRPYGCLYSWKG